MAGHPDVVPRAPATTRWCGPGAAAGGRPGRGAERGAVGAASRPSWRPGRSRVQVNKQRLARTRDLLGYAPGDGVRARRPRAGEGRPGRAPALPRRHPRRPAPPLRRRAGRGRPGAAPAQRPAAAGPRAPRRVRRAHPRRVRRQAGRRRRRARPGCGSALCERLAPALAAAYAAVAVGAEARAAVDAALRLGVARREAAWPRPWPRPGATTCGGARRPVGPHRDELVLAVGGLPARTHAVQGEQRSLALALRLAAHGVVTADGRDAADAAARRRVLRARPRPLRRPARVAAAGPGAADLGRRPARRGPRPSGSCAVEAVDDPAARRAVDDRGASGS